MEEKIGILENIIPHVDLVLIGGGAAAAFLQVRNPSDGGFPEEPGTIVQVETVTKQAKTLGVRILLPDDVVVTAKPEPGAAFRIVASGQIPDGYRIADIGPLTLAVFTRELQQCRTVAWNGPMGVFEIPQFSKGTKDIAKVLSRSRWYNGNRRGFHGRSGKSVWACKKNDPCFHRGGRLPPVPFR